MWTPPGAGAPKRQTPDVPMFKAQAGSADMPQLKAAPSARSSTESLARSLRGSAEEERRRKAGFAQGSTRSAVGQPTSRAPDCIGGKVDESLEVFQSKAKSAAGGELVTKRKFGMVYGFAEERSSKGEQKRALALRLEPLSKRLPEFERVLSEGHQDVTVGAHRGLADVVVLDDGVSKRHCALALVAIKHDLALSVTDFSTNGTWVNGERLLVKGKRFRVHNGDRLCLKDPSLDDDFGWKVDFGVTTAFFTR